MGLVLAIETFKSNILSVYVNFITMYYDQPRVVEFLRANSALQLSFEPAYVVVVVKKIKRVCGLYFGNEKRYQSSVQKS